MQAGPINGFTSAAMLGNGIGVAGFFAVGRQSCQRARPAHLVVSW
ncbi:hypothetical protein [Nannocystis pusilla]|nr:hypothetical protein [Nannocystis pusilla]